MQGLESAHGFGRPGKNCTGPDHSDTKHAVVEDSENATSTSPTDKVGANASPNSALLQSLVELVQVLSTEMKSIREETNKLCTLVYPTTSSHQQIAPVSPHIMLPELRAMTDLTKMIDRCVKHLNLIPSKDRDSKNGEEPLQH